MLRPANLGTCKLLCLVCYFRVSVSSFSMVFFNVGLNTKQNSPAAHCSAKQNSIVKLNLNSTEIAPVGIKCEKSRHKRKDAKRCEKSHVLWKKSRLCYIMHIELNLDPIDVIKNKCQ